MGLITAAALASKINAARKLHKKSNIGCGKGLIARVSITGECSFYARSRQTNGKYTNVKIGEYPKMSLSSAREKA